MIIKDMITSREDLRAVRFDIAAIDDSFLIPDEPTDIFDYAGLSARRLAEYFLD